MIKNFYTTPFMEVILEPRPKWEMASAVNAVLAGEIHGGWQLYWRLRAFFWIVRIQRLFPMLPRIKYD